MPTGCKDTESDQEQDLDGDTMEGFVMLEITDPPSEPAPNESGLLAEYLQDKVYAEGFSERAVGSICKRSVSGLAGLPFKIFLASGWLAPLRYVSQSYAGSWGKRLGTWCMQQYHEKGLTFFVPSASLSDFRVPSIEQNQDATTWWQTSQAVVIQIGEDAKHKLTHFRPVDVIEGSAAVVSSAATSSLFVIVGGPLGLLAIPAAIVVDAASKNLLCELSRRWCLKHGGETMRTELVKMLQQGSRQPIYPVELALEPRPKPVILAHTTFRCEAKKPAPSKGPDLFSHSS